MVRTYRKGANGALMDEYERAGGELLQVVRVLDQAAFEIIRDPQTMDEHCRSIQTIVSHVVSSGYGYADYMRTVFGMASGRPPYALLTLQEFPGRFDAMVKYTVATLDGRWTMPEEESMAIRIQSRHGPVYDLEQLLEHAILHIMRHRRQIEKFLANATR
jgi:hypothetical protein